MAGGDTEGPNRECLRQTKAASRGLMEAVVERRNLQLDDG